MITGLILGALFVAFLIWGGGRSTRRRQLDELGLGEDPKTGSSEQLHDPNSFEQTGRPD